jgi:hypothetical protein
MTDDFKVREVLYSTGYGAGWSTWMGDSRESREFALFYEPLIEALKRGDDIGPVVEQFEKEYEAKFGESPYTGGASGLRVGIVEGDFMIEEYDGAESIVEREDADLWF